MRWLTNSIHVLALLCALSIPIAIFNGTLFSWHPTLMALAFLGFMAEGVVTSILFRTKDGQDRVRAIQRHLIWQAFAFLCLLGGFYAIYQNKVVHGKQHFKSVHAKFGLATFILGIIAPLGGLVSFRRLGLLQKFPDKLQPRLKWAHRNVGLLTWLLALVTIQLALTHHAVWKGWLTRVWQLGVACLGVAVLALTWRQPRARPGPASPDFELVMEPTRKHTPDLPRMQAGLVNRCWQVGVALLGAAVLALAVRARQSGKGRGGSVLPMYGIVYAAHETKAS